MIKVRKTMTKCSIFIQVLNCKSFKMLSDFVWKLWKVKSDILIAIFVTACYLQ